MAILLHSHWENCLTMMFHGIRYASATTLIGILLFGVCLTSIWCLSSFWLALWHVLESGFCII